MIQPVVITYYFGSPDCFARVLTDQVVTEAGTLRGDAYTLVFGGLAPEIEADFSAVYGVGDWLDAFLQRHGLTLGSGEVC